MSLFSRLFTLMIVVGIAPLIPTAGFLFHYQKQAKENILQVHQGYSAAASTTIYQHMEGLNQRLVFFEPLQRALARKQKIRAENILKDAMQNNPDFMLVSVLDAKGREEFKVGILDALKQIGFLDRSNSGIFLAAKKSGKISVSNFKLLGAVPSAEVLVPLKQNKYLFLIIDFSKLWSRIKRQTIGITGRVYLADDNGNLFNFKSDISPKISASYLKKKFRENIAGKLTEVPSEFGLFVGAYERVPGFNLNAVTLQHKREAYWAITLTISMILFLLFAISTASYFAAWFFTSKLASPIRNITKGAERVSKRDYSTPLPEHKTFIEFEQLISAFNSMMGKVRRYDELQIDKIIEEKSKTDLLIKLMRDGLVLADANGKILFSNAIAKSIIANKDFEKNMPQKTKNPIQTLVKNIINKEKVSELFELKIGTGIEHYYYKLKYSVLHKNKHESAVMMVFNDVTLERKIDKMKEDFFNSVAHDLRAPLVGLQGYIKLLEYEKLPVKQRAKYLKSMSDSSRKIFALIEDILDISKMESGTLTLKKQEFNLQKLIGGVISTFKPALKSKQIKIIAQLPKKPCIINADERLIERVINNLVSNSIKYTPKGKKITIGYKASLDFHHFEIKDQGRGIGKEEIAKIFDKFYQTDISDQSSGYGLGLAVCRKIVQLHGGNITAESKPGKGTTVTFTLSKKIADIPAI